MSATLAIPATLDGSPVSIVSVEVSSEPIRASSAGGTRWKPGAYRCPQGHEHVVAKPPAMQLPESLERRNDSPMRWCALCRDEHQDYDAEYLACRSCGLHVSVATERYGPEEYVLGYTHHVFLEIQTVSATLGAAELSVEGMSFAVHVSRLGCDPDGITATAVLAEDPTRLLATLRLASSS